MPFFAVPAPTNPRHLLRGILRLARTPDLPKELQRKIQTPQVSMNATRSFVLEQYRRHRRRPKPQGDDHPLPVVAAPDDVHHHNYLFAPLLESIAENYHRLQLDLAERGRLHRLDAGADVVLSPHELSRRAAARAGLQLPKLRDPDDAVADDDVTAAGGAGGR